MKQVRSTLLLDKKSGSILMLKVRIELGSEMKLDLKKLIIFELFLGTILKFLFTESELKFDLLCEMILL